MKLLARWCTSIAIAGLAACASVPGEDVRKELVPTGKLRVGIGVGASPSAFWATQDPATGKPRGVTVDLATALAAKLGVPLELVAKMKAGEVDAIALGRESLAGLAPKIPGARILEGHFHAAGNAVAVPKGRPAAHAYVTQFLEEAKADGTVRRALDGAGFRGLPVAP